MSDEWWKCIIQLNGGMEQLDEARNVVSRGRGIQFEQGLVLQDGERLRALWMPLPWVQECKEYEKVLWEIYQGQQQRIRRAAQEIGRMMSLLDS